MVYREAEEKPRRVEYVHHRPMHPVKTIGIVVLMLVLAGFTLWQSAVCARSTRFDCERGGENTCTVSRTYGFITTEEKLPIHYIAAVRGTSHSTKGGMSYGVEVLMQDGKRVALMRPGSRATSDLVKSGVDLVVFDPNPGRSGLPIQGSSPFAALALLAVGFGISAMALSFARSARLEFDLDRRTIRYRLSRWPLPPRIRVLRADDVLNARVATRTSSKGQVYYETLLALDGEEDLSLVSGGGGNEARSEATASRINTLLDKMREEDA